MATQTDMQTAQTMAPQGPGGTSDAPSTLNRDKVSFMYNKAMELAYERGFEQLVNMFKSGGPKAAPQQLAQAVVSLLDVAEKEAGERATHEELMAVGLLLVAQIYADMVEMGVLQEDDNLLHTAMMRTITKWMSTHPDRMDAATLEKMKGSAPQVGAMMQGQMGPQPPGLLRSPMGVMGNG